MNRCLVLLSCALTLSLPLTLAACGPGPRTATPAARTPAPPPPTPSGTPTTDAPTAGRFIRCVGELLEHVPEAPWFDNWTDADGNVTHDHGRAPLVRFRLLTPDAHRDRIVGVLFKYHGEHLPPPPGPTEKGKRYSFELPGDFFQGESVVLDNIQVKDLKPAP